MWCLIRAYLFSNPLFFLSNHITQTSRVSGTGSRQITCLNYIIGRGRRGETNQLQLYLRAGGGAIRPRSWDWLVVNLSITSHHHCTLRRDNLDRHAHPKLPQQVCFWMDISQMLIVTGACVSIDFTEWIQGLVKHQASVFPAAATLCKIPR